MDQQRTLIVLNPNAAGGKAGALWKQIEPVLWREMGELVLAMTERPEDVSEHLEEAYDSGLTRVISIGGDGTNHALVNALVALNQRHPEGPPMVYGTLPVGTGHDWARNLGIPTEPEAAAHWMCRAEPHPVDIGMVRYGDPPQQRYFLNVASSGISGEISQRVNETPQRRAWTFLQATVATLLSYTPQRMRVTIDDELWRDGPTYLVAVANGTTFGRGMKIAPEAKVDDGLFDVILIEGMTRLRALLALRMVYDGSHLRHPAVHMRRGQTVTVRGMDAPVGLELDGEHTTGRDLVFTLHAGLLYLLL